MDSDLWFNSDYIRAADLKGKDVTLTIAAVGVHQFDEKDAKTRKGLITFKETDKKWGVVKTNQVCLKAMFGSEDSVWVGKRVTLYPGEVYMPTEGKNVAAIRVRGSPDLEKDLTIKIKHPHKAPVTVVLKKTK